MCDTQEYNVQKAIRAQAQFCDLRDAPLFAPSDGVCHRCRNNIYKASVYRAGISLIQAAMTHITSCPHCHATFLD